MIDINRNCVQVQELNDAKVSAIITDNIFLCHKKMIISYKILALCPYDVNWDIFHYYFTLVLELKTLQNKLLNHYKNVKCRLQANEWTNEQ